MKNKQLKLKLRTLSVVFTPLKLLFAVGFFVAFTFFTLYGFMQASALPGERYRYSGNVCGASDGECFKYSAEAGTYRGYKGVLNRQPDSAGFSYWTQRLLNGSSSLNSMAGSLLASSEWQAKYSAINNQQFVTQTYQFLLGRNPSAGENSYWTNELNSSHQNRSQVAANFINSSEGANFQHAAFMNYFRPPAPTPNPTPSPTPAPKPTPKPSSSTPQAPTQSRSSASGLQITDFIISQTDYQTALLTWKTNKPSSSKVNYSTNKDDLYLEQKSDEPKTEHSIKLENEELKAGRTYFVRITSDDGGGPVTIDGEFNTKLVPVIIKVTSENEQPVDAALVTIGESEHTTNAQGEIAVELPEGEITIFAEKDSLSQQILATIEVPTDGNPQRITLSLSETAEAEITTKTSATKRKGTPLWLTLLLSVLVLGAGAGGFLVIRKRRHTTKVLPYNDPLEADNYSGSQIPSTPDLSTPPQENAVPAIPFSPSPLPAQPEPTYQQLHDPSVPHHASLPELAGRYGQVTPPELPEIPEPLTPAGQKVPHHESLAHMVHLPDQDAPIEDTPGTSDLPSSPLEKTKEHQDTQTESTGDDTSLTIKH